MKLILRIVAIGWAILYYVGPSFGQTGFSLSVSVSPFYGHSVTERAILLPDIQHQGDPLAARFNTRGANSGFSVGIMGRYEFSPHWSATTGVWLNYSWVGVPTVITEPYIDYLATTSRSRNYQLPWLVNYRTSPRRLSPYFSVGAVLSFPGTTYLRINDRDIAIQPSNKSVKVLPIAGAGISYRLGNHLALIAQPTFQYTIPPSDVVYARIYQIGLLTQLLYKF